ncbi:TetR/AcrR family transcriptional regulator, partial [Jatrophihabitans sp. YIM 134969]
AGTRVRAGNAMARTRSAILDGAARAVAADGTAITMAQVASLGGVAKATLYNHFRTREAVLGALAVTEVEAVAAEVSGLGLRHALVEMAAAVATHPCLATLREREPGVVAAALADPEPAAAIVAARSALVGVVRNAGIPDDTLDLAADLLLRWLVSLAIAPPAPAEVLAAVDLLLAGLLA